ncbi:hypothetical protein M4578_22805 [Salipiger sp. P9]|uniref:hypothetical protein n=1 Tax=Salipiger pentaromativorans TaxID=2943193 RepID=UPI00215740AB|nr:hypothetical protein [Salipiger pentaromativorans]MCR8550664.1 hypothetical protein [Salipiger pentaromativorans]
MLRKRYPLPAFFLALALALTGYQMAAARAQPTPVGEIVICSGLGLMTVLVDEEGNPVNRTHVCPDGLLTLFGAAGGAWVPPPHEEIWMRIAAAYLAAYGAGLRAPVPMARDPPSVV